MTSPVVFASVCKRLKRNGMARFSHCRFVQGVRKLLKTDEFRCASRVATRNTMDSFFKEQLSNGPAAAEPHTLLYLMRQVN